MKETHFASIASPIGPRPANRLPSFADQRGAALLFVALVVSVLGLMAVGSLAFFNSGIDRLMSGSLSSGTLLAAEAMRAPIVETLQTALQKDETISVADLQTKLASDLPPLLPEGFRLASVQIPSYRDLPFGPISIGPFSDLPATRKEAVVTYEIRPDDGRSTGVRISLTVALSRISPLQFGQFWDRPFTDVYWPGGLRVNGRIHANGDICVSGIFWGPLEFVDRMTSAGRAMHGGDPRCRNSTNWYDNMTLVRNPAGVLFNFSRGPETGGGNTNGCTNCSGLGQAWKSYSLWTLDSAVLDSAVNVPPLKLPQALLTRTQRGLDGRAGNAVAEQASNASNLRFLVDPPLPAEDPEAAKLKFSTQADLRILDGAWYLKDPANPNSWPGIPIWSDHPGEATDRWGQAVGQTTLRAARAWGAATPRRFSPYRYDEVAQRLVPTFEGTLFYGATEYVPSRPDYQVVPGAITNRCNGNWFPHPYCYDPRTPTVPGQASFTGCHASPLGAPMFCLYPLGAGFIVRPMPLETLLLLGTRQGFRTVGFGNDRDKVFPANFSLKRLADAFNDTAPGELGSYFRGAGRAFNGIVYISMSWPGQDTGYGGAAVPNLMMAPIQGTASDPLQIPSGYMAPHEQTALPTQLCSNTLAGQPLDQDSIGAVPLSRFRVPDCRLYGTGPGMISAFPNSIRLVEGEDLSSFAPRGLTVASNIPVYVEIDYNVGTWVPALVAGDQVTFMNGRVGALRPNWGPGGYAGDGGSRYANVGVLGGFDSDYSTAGNTSVEMPGRMDGWAEWRGNLLNFTGSAVMGFHPIFFRTSRGDGGTAPTTYRHESRFNFPGTRPPGMPEIWTGQVTAWQRY